MNEHNFIANLESVDVEFYENHKDFLNDDEIQISIIDFENLGI